MPVIECGPLSIAAQNYTGGHQLTQILSLPALDGLRILAVLIFLLSQITWKRRSLWTMAARWSGVMVLAGLPSTMASILLLRWK